MIEVRDAVKRIGTSIVVDGVSFTAANGQVTGLLGPNGAGKTTTLRLISGLMAADAGSIAIDGQRMRAGVPRGTMGVLPDELGLYARMTGEEHIDYFAQLRGLKGAERDERKLRMIETVGLGEVAGRRVAGYSRGERVKLALACALVHEPRNVVLDEPTNGLDVMSTRAIRAFVRKLRDEGRCVLFSSHVMQEVSALCDTIVVLAKGRVAATGTPRELVARAGASTLEDAFVRLAGEEAALSEPR